MLKKLPVFFLIGVLSVAGLGVLLDMRGVRSAEVNPAAQSEDDTGEWSTLRGNAARTGTVAGTGPTASPEVAWRFNQRPDIPLIGSPVVADGVVYTSGNSGDPEGDAELLYALDAATGTELWHASAGYFTDVEAHGGGLLLSVDASAVYVAGTEGEAQCDCMPPAALYALDLDGATGRELWRHSYGRDMNQSVPAVVDGTVYIAVDDYEGGAVYAFDAGTGAILWTTHGDEPSFDSIPVAVNGGAVYAIARSIDSQQSFLVSLDASTGVERWSSPLGQFADASAAVTADTAFVTTYDIESNPAKTYLIAVDVATGAERWRVQLEGDSSGVPTTWEDTVYVGTVTSYGMTGVSGPLLALDAKTGKERWRVEDALLPAVGGNVLYANGDGGILALDAATGAEIWRMPDTASYGSVLVSNGMLFAIGQGGLIGISGSTEPAAPTGAPAEPGANLVGPGLEEPATNPAKATTAPDTTRQSVPNRCFDIYVDLDGSFEADAAPAGAPMAIVCDADDNPTGQADGILTVGFPAGEYIAVLQPDGMGSNDCGPDFWFGFKVTPPETGPNQATEIPIPCGMSEEGLDQPGGLPGGVEDEGSPQASSEMATVTVALVPADFETGSIEVLVGVCLSIRNVSSTLTPPIGVCNNQPPDTDDSEKFITFELPTGSSYEVDLAPAFDGSLTAASIDEQGLRPLTSAGGTVEIQLGTLAEQPGADAMPVSSISVINADGSNFATLISIQAPSSGPVWAPDSTKIAFAGALDPANAQIGETDIWTMNADGSNPTLLAPVPGWDLRPSWSPDGTKIAFFNGNGTLYVVGVDGSGLRELAQVWPLSPGMTGMPATADPTSSPPSWSDDGTKITFASAREGGLEVWVVGVDGSGLTRLTDYGEVATTTPSNQGEPFTFSIVTMICPDQVDPSGVPAKILLDADPAQFESQGCRRARVGEASYLFEIKAAGKSGAKRPQVIEATSDEQGLATISGYLDPDAILYQLVETAPVYLPLQINGPPFAATYVVANSGRAPAGEGELPGEVLEIPGEGMGGPSSEQEASSPVWSPDGSRIAFFVLGPVDEFSGQSTSGGVYLMNPDGSDVRQLTDLMPMPYEPPAWSPDGSKFLFLAAGDGYGMLWYVVNADGTGLTKLSLENREVWTASWSSDGRIVAAHAGEGGFSISTMNADGTGLTDLFTGATPVSDAAWSPDGTKIAFITIPESQLSGGD